MARPAVHGEETRIRLVEEAARILHTEGPHALTTRRVAAEAGTTTNALYRLIGGKEELLRAMYREGFERLAAAFAAVPRTDDPVADLYGIGAAYLAHALANPHLYEVMFACPAPEFDSTDEDRTFALSTFETNIAAVARCVDAGQLYGDPLMIATELWCVSHGVASLALAGMIPAEQAGAIHDQLAAAVFIGLSTPPPS
jgi:AcrR family transcriptional regulator